MADRALLQAALIGFETEYARIQSAISEIRRQLRQKGGTQKDGGAVSSGVVHKRHKMSAAARKRIAAAQRARWAKFHAEKK